MKAAAKRRKAPEAKASAPVESSQLGSTEPSFDHNSSDEAPDRRAKAAEAHEAAPVSAMVRSEEKDAYDFDEKTDATEDTLNAYETWDIYVRWGNSELPLEVNSGITNKELKELIKIKTGGRLTPERCKLMWHEREIDEYGEEIHLQDIGVVDRSRLDLFIFDAKAKAHNPLRLAAKDAAAGTPEAAATNAAAVDNTNTLTKQGHVIKVGEDGTRTVSNPPGRKRRNGRRAVAGQALLQHQVDRGGDASALGGRQPFWRRSMGRS